MGVRAVAVELEGSRSGRIAIQRAKIAIDTRENRLRYDHVLRIGVYAPRVALGRAATIDWHCLHPAGLVVAPSEIASNVELVSTNPLTFGREYPHGVIKRHRPRLFKLGAILFLGGLALQVVDALLR